MDRTGRYPTTEEVLSSLGVVVNKGNLGALQDITDEAYNAVAGREGTFTDLVPRLAELTSSLDRQTDDIISGCRRARTASPESWRAARTVSAARWIRCPRR